MKLKSQGQIPFDLSAATKKQSKYLWVICRKISTGAEGVNWWALRSDVTKKAAIELIGQFKLGEEAEKGGDKDKAAAIYRELVDKLRVWAPGIKVLPEYAEKIPEPEPEPEPVIEPEPVVDPEPDEADEPEPEPLPIPGLDLSKLSDDYILPKEFDVVARHVVGGENVLLTGPAGCGKSRLLREIAQCMGAAYHACSLGGGVRYSAVFGSGQVKDGESYFKTTRTMEAMQRPGVVVFEEIFGCDPDVLLGLNGILEPDTRALETEAGQIKVDSGCSIAATANITGRSVSRQYTGAQRSDDSLLDRFTAIPCKYDERVEAKILLRIKSKVARKFFRDSLKVLRAKVRENNIPFDPSTRRLCKVARSLELGLSKEQAFEYNFLSTLSTGERAKVGL